MTCRQEGSGVSGKMTIKNIQNEQVTMTDQTG